MGPLGSFPPMVGSRTREGGKQRIREPSGKGSEGSSLSIRGDEPGLDAPLPDFLVERVERKGGGG